MATIDLTLDALLVPAIEGYTPPFGTKITKTSINNGGLSTLEVNSNIMLPFANMRPKVITENSSTTEIEYDAKLCFSASLLAGATLELDDGAYDGCRVQITNLSSFACDVEYNSATLVSIPIGANVEVLWTGSTWMLSTTGTIASGNIMAPTSSAVHAAIDEVYDKYKWTALVTRQNGGTFTVPETATEIRMYIFASTTPSSANLCGFIEFKIADNPIGLNIPCNDVQRSMWDASNNGRTYTLRSGSNYSVVTVYYR